MPKNKKKQKPNPNQQPKRIIPEEIRATHLINSVFVALKNLNYSGTNIEILEQVIKNSKLPEELINMPHNNSTTELDYNLGWAKTCLKRTGVIISSERSVWSIIPEFRQLESVSNKKIYYASRENKILKPSDLKNIPDEPLTENLEVIIEDKQTWKSTLADILKNMNPYGFERLTMLLLRECGFSNVKVTKKSGDGGIDGTAILKINGIFSFSIAFQCKRYSSSVGAPAIRDFRGSLASDVEKGVFITTGYFTEQAKEEAFAQGKKQIDLMDGEAFMEKLAEYQIGLKEVIIKDYEIQTDFFEKV